MEVGTNVFAVVQVVRVLKLMGDGGKARSVPVRGGLALAETSWMAPPSCVMVVKRVCVFVLRFSELWYSLVRWELLL